MKKIILKKISLCMAIAFALLISGFISVAKAQVQSSGDVTIVIDGTSNIHDWDIKSEKSDCVASYTIDQSGVLTALTSLKFTVKVESLKSGKGAMDKNTYKAIKSDKYPVISFLGTSSSVKHDGGNNYTILCNGKLTISGVTKYVTLTANCTLGSDNSLKGTGSYKLKMTEFNVTPPSIMFGAIKTGDNVTINYDFNLAAS